MRYFFISSTETKKKEKRKKRFALVRSPDKINCMLGYVHGTEAHIDFVTEISKREYKKGMKYAKKTFVKGPKSKVTSF